MSFIYNIVLYSGSALAGVSYVNHGAEIGFGMLLCIFLILHVLNKLEYFMEKIKND